MNGHLFIIQKSQLFTNTFFFYIYNKQQQLSVVLLNDTRFYFHYFPLCK